VDLTAVPVPMTLALAAWVLAVVVVAGAARRAQFSTGAAVHVPAGGAFCVAALWTVQATVGDGFTFHLLGVAAYALIAGPAWALIGSAVAVGVLVAVRDALWINAGLAFLTMAAIPVAVTWGVLHFAERRLPPNFFVYVFVAAFFGAAAAYGGASVAGATVLTLGAGRPADLVFGEYLPYMLYLAFGEATLTGMVLTLAIVYRPQWVATFDDARYLKGR
jgi:uncharacterized membrane protein